MGRFVPQNAEALECEVYLRNDDILLQEGDLQHDFEFACYSYTPVTYRKTAILHCYHRIITESIVPL